MLITGGWLHQHKDIIIKKIYFTHDNNVEIIFICKSSLNFYIYLFCNFILGGVVRRAPLRSLVTKLSKLTKLIILTKCPNPHPPLTPLPSYTPASSSSLLIIRPIAQLRELNEYIKKNKTYVSVIPRYMLTYQPATLTAIRQSAMTK